MKEEKIPAPSTTAAFSTAANDSTKKRRKYKIEFAYTKRDSVVFKARSPEEAVEMAVSKPHRNRRIFSHPVDGFCIEAIEPVDETVEERHWSDVDPEEAAFFFRLKCLMILAGLLMLVVFLLRILEKYQSLGN